MSKKTTKELRRMDAEQAAETLLLHALGLAGRVLRPYPNDIDPHDLDAGVALLREQGLVHGSQREPNLTAKGVEAAQEMAEA